MAAPELPRWVWIYWQGWRPAVWIRTIEQGPAFGHAVVLTSQLVPSTGRFRWAQRRVPPDVVGSDPVRTEETAEQVVEGWKTGRAA